MITYVSSIYDAFPKVPEGGEGISAIVSTAEGWDGHFGRQLGAVGRIWERVCSLWKRAEEREEGPIMVSAL